jgi:hypothetical protein
MVTVLAILTALSLILHIPAVEKLVKKSKTTIDDKVVEAIDKAKDALED